MQMRDKEIKKAKDSDIKGLHKRVMAGHSDNSLSSDLNTAAKVLVSSGGKAFERADGMMGSVMTFVADEEEQDDEKLEEEGEAEGGKRKGEVGTGAAKKKQKKTKTRSGISEMQMLQRVPGRPNPHSQASRKTCGTSFALPRRPWPTSRPSSKRSSTSSLWRAACLRTASKL
jgi:hypothetical protein